MLNAGQAVVVVVGVVVIDVVVVAVVVVVVVAAAAAAFPTRVIGPVDDNDIVKHVNHFNPNNMLTHVIPLMSRYSC